MKILIACEFSGIVRDAFKAKGHDAWSCDLLPTERPGNHIQDDVLKHLDNNWDLLIAHPPCTHLAVSGARWFKEKRKDGRMEQGYNFFMKMINAPIEKIAVENPIGVLSKMYRKPDQIIQPFWFGDSVQKATCLWLKNLPKLEPTNIVEPEFTIYKSTGKRVSRYHYDSFYLPKCKRGKIKSITFQGIANAMADQWGTKE